uniref:C2H2-type domain-containing protein n=1 Tax=Trichogramma kaykai TaxID=54128 RepID=A0ABD2WR67_9HYME
MIKNYDNGPPYECDSCDDTYEDKKNLTIHKMERSIVRAREQFKTRNSHVCSVCGSAFKTSSELVAHYEYCRSCHQTRAQQLCSVVCEICNRKFKDLKSQKAHKAWSHSIDILCPLCDERLSSPEELLVHQTSVHAKESRPSCKYCGKSFDECLTLEAHVACHEGENGPVSCSYCEKIFRHEHYLKRHVESVHQDPGRMVVLETSNLRENNKEIKMYKCEHCEYETKTRRFFLLHADKHNAPERKECELCGKKLRPKYFNIHMRIHMDDFKCDKCGKIVDGKRKFVQHMAMHGVDQTVVLSAVGSEILSIRSRADVAEPPRKIQRVVKDENSLIIPEEHNYSHRLVSENLSVSGEIQCATIGGQVTVKYIKNE